jgi:23S rRNA G2445 N2-methylase RlmL
VQPGLEPVAADEITRDLGGEVRRTGAGFVVFRVPHVDASVLGLRTTEDVFLLAWGTDGLSHRAQDLERITRWTARDANWAELLRIHHGVRPKPRGKPTYRLVTQMQGTHGYRRVDAREALARGLRGKFPASWLPAEENAAVEVWLTIQGATAYCGLRLSDRTMRHRTYKHEHLPASLRPTVAAAAVRVAEIRPGQTVLDPMCGAGTILAEALAWAGQRRGTIRAWGGDRDGAALRAAASNLRTLGRPLLVRWDAARLPLADGTVDRIVSNPPFGVQLGRPEEIGPLYGRMVEEYDRVLRPRGAAVLLVADLGTLREAARKAGWEPGPRHRIRVLGQPATLARWNKAPKGTRFDGNV